MLWQDLSDFYSHFLDRIGVMAILIDAGGTVRLFNRKAEELTGFTKQEAVGQDWFKLMVPDRERESMRSRLRICLREGIDQMAYAMPFTARSGAKRQACWSFSSVRNDDGKLFGMIALGQVPPWPDAPCLSSARSMDRLCDSVDSLTHDLLNQAQVALGFIELAAEPACDDQDRKNMLDRACTAVKRSGDLAYNIQRITHCPVPATKSPK